MARKMIDCRQIPNDIGCTLTVAGEEAEVLEASYSHAVNTHKYPATDETRAALRNALVDAEPAMA
jgi:hypothetical protein